MAKPVYNVRQQDQSGYLKDFYALHGMIDTLGSKLSAFVTKTNNTPAASGTTTTIVQQVPAPSSPTGLTSVGITLPTNTFSWTPATLTNNGSIAVSYLTQTANKFHASPNGSTGLPLWRNMVAADLPNTAVTASSYGDATHVAAFTVDAQGRLVAAVSVPITYPTPPVVPSFADNEVPSGLINGINTSFTVAHAPSPTTSVHLHMSGLRITPTGNFTVSGPTITFAIAPAIGAVLLVDYRY